MGICTHPVGGDEAAAAFHVDADGKALDHVVALDAGFRRAPRKAVGPTRDDGAAAYVALTSPIDPFLQGLVVSQAITLPVLAGLLQLARRLLRQHREVAGEYWKRQLEVEEEKCRLAQDEAKLRSFRETAT